MSKSARIVACMLGIALVGCASQPKQLAPAPASKPAPVPAQPPPSPMEPLVKALKARAYDGDAVAMTCLGEMYLLGSGVNQDLDSAKTYISQGNGKNYPLAEVLEAALVTSRPELGAYVMGAEKQVQELAKAGDPEAQAYLGVQTLYGSHVIRIKGDPAASAHWLQLAADQDNAYGEAELAAAYKHGWGVPQDPAQARQWLEKAAHHSFDCIADYERVVQAMVQANVTYPEKVPAYATETAVLELPVNGAAGLQPKVATSSGDPAFDAAALEAAIALPLPTWTASPGDAQVSHVGVQFDQIRADPTSNYAVQEWEAEFSAALYQESNVLWAQNPYRTQAQGMVLISLDYKDGKVSDVKVMQSSGDAVLDANGVKSAESAALPAVLPKLAGLPIHLSYWFSDSWDSPCFEDPDDEPHSSYATAVRAAVCKAEVAPRHALLFGTSGSGITAVAFDIHAGKVERIRVTRSSGDAEVDKAAADAVRHAHLPPMPADSAKHTLHITTHVIFELGSNTVAPAAATAPGAG